MMQEMKLLRNKAAGVIAIILIFGVPTAPACSWAIGYFYQVTSLRGATVGSNLPFLHSIRWLRQSFVREHVKLTLYDYRWPRAVSDWVPVKSVITDADGKFDFGAVKPGHYTLRVDEEKWPHSDLFDVEIKDPPNPKESETIDISPVSPDCKGGHEFIVKLN
jgi:hypothetical protein